MIKRDWIQRYTQMPAREGTTFILQSWDTAMKGGPDNDWSVCTTWLETQCQWYLLDVWRKRVDYPTLKGAVVELAAGGTPSRCSSRKRGLRLVYFKS